MANLNRKAALALGVFVLALALPAFAGGDDVPAIPPGSKHVTPQGGSDTPVVPPGHHVTSVLGSPAGAGKMKLPLYALILRGLLVRG